MTGNTLASPHVELDRDTAKRFYNGMAGHAEMFKNNMKLHGVDIDKGEIVKAPAGFNPKRGQ
jgi:hypothetical protein